MIVGLVTAIGFGLSQTGWHALSAFYGSLISMISALILGRGVSRASNAAISDPKMSMGILYAGAVFRFLLVLVLFVLGLLIFKLNALAVGAGFILAQLGFVFNFQASKPGAK